MKKIIPLGIGIFMIFTILTSCNQMNGDITLESMKKTLINAGYTINEDYAEFYELNQDSINSVGGFSFIFAGAHGNINTPVLEFKDNVSAESYAKIVNHDGNFLAIVNDTFLTIAEAHNGIPHENEKIFLENLINGALNKNYLNK